MREEAVPISETAFIAKFHVHHYALRSKVLASLEL
jgi:hypothetical protein